MSRIKIHIEDIVGIAGNDYRLVRDMPEGKLLRSVDRPTDVEFFDNAELQQVLEEGMLSVRRQGDIPTSKDLALARYRQIACETLLGQGFDQGPKLTNSSLEEVLPEVRDAWTRHAEASQSHKSCSSITVPRYPNAQSLRRWLRSYDGTTASLIRRPRATRVRDPLEGLDERVAKAIRHGLEHYLSHSRPTVVHAYRLVVANVRWATAGQPGDLSVPSLSTFRRIVQRMPIAPEGMALRAGTRKAEAHYREVEASA